MDDSEYQPTGAEIDDYRLLGNGSVPGEFKLALVLFFISSIIFIIGFVLGAVVGAQMF